VDQVIEDQIEQEVGGDATVAAMFGLAHGPVLLAQPKMHSIVAPARLRHAITLVPRGALIDGTFADLVSFGDGGSASHVMSGSRREDWSRDRRYRRPCPHRL
jgi:hypothetical protein